MAHSAVYVCTYNITKDLVKFSRMSIKAIAMLYHKKGCSRQPHPYTESWEISEAAEMTQHDWTGEKREELSTQQIQP